MADTTARRPAAVPGPVRRPPLPDAGTVRVIPVPDAAPPYDDTGPHDTARRYDTVKPVRRTASFQPGPRRRPRSHPDGSSSDDSTWPGRFAQVLAETLAGSRPPAQIVPWTTEQARRRISQLGPLMTTGDRPRVRRVIVTSPTGGVLEMTVIVGLGGRIRAVAARLEHTPDGPHPSPGRTSVGAPGTGPASGAGIGPASAGPGSDGRWRCTAIEAA